MKTSILSLIFTLIVSCGFAQEADKITQWQFKFAQNDFRVGEDVEVIFLATIEKGWSLYSSDFKSDMGPQPTEFEFSENGTFALLKAINPITPLKKIDKNWGTDITYFTQKAEFRSKVRIEENKYDVAGTIRGQLCNDKKGVCVPFQKDFHFPN
ncbi:MAG: protein-disulfide reductase DsbD domain-containing protein [Bacteroidota bacterium]|jgi:thiol:disulfide interchange protein DsbD